MKTILLLIMILAAFAFLRRRKRPTRARYGTTNRFMNSQSGHPPTSPKDKGTIFEDYVVDLLADSRLTLLDRTQDRMSSRGVYAESCKNPDLHIRQIHGNGHVDYYLECKYKSQRNDDGTVTFDDYKIARYHRFQRDKHRKVLLAVGIGQNPAAPEEFLIVPLDALRGNALPRDVAAFRVSPTPGNLIAYIDRYFDNLFTKRQ